MTTLDPPDSCDVDESEPPKTTGLPVSSSLGWFQSTLNESTEIWGQIKRDISDVAKTVMSNDPLAAARETASTVFRHVCEAVQSGSADPTPPAPDQKDEVIEEIDTVEIDVDAIKSTLGGMVVALERGINEMVGSNIFSFGLGNTPERTPYNREACIEIIRADPSTFEQLPPATQDVLSYEAWRQAFFDPNSCTPRPNMPVFVGCSIPLLDKAEEKGILSFPHSVPPARVLDESPVVRQHLLRLVDPTAHQETSEVSTGLGGFSEADFWSRYYYRVWCLDVQEVRRRQMSERDHLKVNELETAAWPVLDTNEDRERAQEQPTPKRQTSPQTQRLAETVASLSNPSSSVVLVNSDDEEHESSYSSNSSEENPSNQNSAPASEETGGKLADYENAIHFTTEDLKDAEIDPKQDLNEDDASEGSDWEKWT